MEEKVLSSSDKKDSQPSVGLYRPREDDLDASSPKRSCSEVQVAPSTSEAPAAPRTDHSVSDTWMSSARVIADRVGNSLPPHPISLYVCSSVVDDASAITMNVSRYRLEGAVITSHWSTSSVIKTRRKYIAIAKCPSDRHFVKAGMPLLTTSTKIYEIPNAVYDGLIHQKCAQGHAREALQPFVNARVLPHADNDVGDEVIPNRQMILKMRKPSQQKLAHQNCDRTQVAKSAHTSCNADRLVKPQVSRHPDLQTNVGSWSVKALGPPKDDPPELPSKAGGLLKIRVGEPLRRARGG
ncbi:Hypothetical protein PHPALM_1033 [Phytophthora palmivora]|uniref:Uncharacterized protein n=1 Tax=Phytophthora palmivora TaxID=4796 RepID=A0A2P4YTD8_9STRA|nr:Hypothetical protein PHPALM_1033 [Phytophthora palmivora]